MKLRVPSTAALLMLIIVIATIMTYFVPAGVYDRIVDSVTGRTVVVASSYHSVEQSPVGFWAFLASVFKGILKASDIIAFIFVVGGAFEVVSRSGAIHAALGHLIKKVSGKEEYFIPICMFAFALGGATFGMAEETLPFVAIMLIAARSLKYDAIVGVSLVTLGVYAGYAAGPLNPFSIGIAHSIAQLPIFSGIGLRTVLCAGSILIAVHHTMKYAKEIRLDPTKSLLWGTETSGSSITEPELDLELTQTRKIILVLLLLTLGYLIYAVLHLGWYFEEISALFMLMGIVVGMITYKGNLDKYAEAFMDGAKSLTVAALLVGLSRAVLVVMEDGSIMDTIVYALALPLGHLHSVFAAWGMFLAQGVINFFIPSSSGQAVVVMPIFSPLSDVIGLSRQIACQAYQAGDGFWNMITPTHPVLMASLGIAGVSFGKWFRYAWPLVLKWSIWTCTILTVGVFIGW